MQLPEHLANQGVLMAEIYGIKGENVQIDGGTNSTSLFINDGHLVLPLSPGKHILNGISFTRAKGASTVTTTLHLDRSFDIAPGRITNLGLVLFASDQKDQRQFHAYWLDNTPEARRYLRARYPSISASLRDNDFLLAPGDYVPVSEIPKIRRLIGSLIASGNLAGTIEDSDSNSVVGGPGGLIGQYVIREEKIVDLKIFDTATLANVVDVSRLGDRHLIAMADGSLFLLEQGRVTSVGAPPNAGVPGKVKLLPGGMVVVDQRLAVYWSIDDGKHWQNYRAAQLTNSILMNDIVITGNKSGLAVYTKNSSQTKKILYSDADNFTFRQIPLPPETAFIRNIACRESGIFIEPEDARVSREEVIYFKAKGTDVWIPRTMPGTYCEISYTDDTGNLLKASCRMSFSRTMHSYMSKDGGEHWQGL